MSHGMKNKCEQCFAESRLTESNECFLHPTMSSSMPEDLEMDIVSRLNVGFKYTVGDRDRFSDLEDFLKEVLEEAFTAGYKDGVKAGLMEAREMMPEEDTPKGFCHLINLQNPCEGYNAYRKEALARLNDKINRLK